MWNQASRPGCFINDENKYNFYIEIQHQIQNLQIQLLLNNSF